MRNIINSLVLSVLIFACNSCGIFGLERFDYDLEMDFCVENMTGCQIEVFIQLYVGDGSLRPYTYKGLVDNGEIYTFCGGQVVAYRLVKNDEEVFHRIVVGGSIREDTYVQVTNLDDGTVVRWFAKDSPKAYFYDFASWRKEDSEALGVPYRKYILTLTNEIFENIP